MRAAVLRTALRYFALVFAAGFALGAVRTLWLVPRFGARASELAETPLMVIVTFLVARSVVRRTPHLVRESQWLAVGAAALAWMVSVEFTVVLAIRGLSVADWWAGRDPVSTGVYGAALGFFALCPWLCFRVRSRSRARGGDAAR